MASPNDKAKNMLFDKRKGYRKGEFVRFVAGPAGGHEIRRAQRAQVVDVAEIAPVAPGFRAVQDRFSAFT